MNIALTEHLFLLRSLDCSLLLLWRRPVILSRFGRRVPLFLLGPRGVLLLVEERLAESFIVVRLVGLDLVIVDFQRERVRCCWGLALSKGLPKDYRIVIFHAEVTHCVFSFV